MAASVGASHAGVVFAPSPRRMTADGARKVFDAAGPSVKHVGVFVSESADEVGEIASALALDAVQLHRDIDDRFVDALRRRFAGDIWIVVGVEGSQLEAGWPLAAAPLRANAIVLDTSVHGRTGGTGQPFDWESVSAGLVDRGLSIPLVVAGGLNPRNVGVAVTTLRPHVVDVSSGVESSPGIKDHDLMRAFAEAVHSASIV